MEEGHVRDRGNHEAAMSAPSRGVPFRDYGSIPSSTTLEASQVPSSRTLEGSHAPSTRTLESIHEMEPRHGWIGALSRLQEQVSYNASLLEGERRRLDGIETKFHSLDRSMDSVNRGMHDLANEMRAEMRAELRARPASSHQSMPHDGDIEVLSRQMQAMAEKVNEVQGLKMQIDLMKNRLRRFEEGSPAPQESRPASSLTREHSLGERQHYLTVTEAPQGPQRPMQLPPMRTSSISSPAEGRSVFHQPPPPMSVLQSQHGPQGYLPPTIGSTGQTSSASSQRSGEQLPPIASFQPPPPPPGSWQQAPREAGPGAWSTVNQAPKRPHEEQQSSNSLYSSSIPPGQTKRPKLAPIMPRDESQSSYVPSTATQQSTVDSYNARNRSSSNASLTQTQSSFLPTPASATTPAYRFITSTAQNDSQESWRPESERPELQIRELQTGPPRSVGRGRGRGRGRRGRGAHPSHQQDLGPPEWERPGWSPDEYYQQHHPQHVYSPRQERGELVRRGGGLVGHPVPPEHQDQQQNVVPATPLGQQSGQDPFAGAGAGGEQTSGGNRKSRTKPVRNAEGILIRKDGRPDMRSVSSANNLRKVHAKRETERTENEGRTPTSARSLAPANSQSLSDEQSDDGREHQHGTAQERHHALMGSMFPRELQGAVAADRGPPSRQDTQGSVAVKTEAGSSSEEGEQQFHQHQQEQQRQPTGSQMTDLDMREMSEAQAANDRERQHERQGEDRDGDAKMAATQETGEEQAAERSASS